jgi:hypothetical protein
MGSEYHCIIDEEIGGSSSGKSIPWTASERKSILGSFPDKLICDYKIEECTEFMFFDNDKVSDYVDITVAHPKVVSALRNLLEYPGGGEKNSDFFKDKKERDNNIINGVDTKKTFPQWPSDIYGVKIPQYNCKSELRIFEADVDFILRHLVDNHSLHLHGSR